MTFYQAFCARPLLCIREIRAIRSDSLCLALNSRSFGRGSDSEGIQCDSAPGEAGGGEGATP